MPQLVQNGQNPELFIISCIDSRGNPGTIFNAVPGLFFAHKAMGAIVRPYKKGTALSAALQFALAYNKVRDIVILGHTGCGAIKALVEQIEDEEISSFINVAHKGLERARHACGESCAHADLLRLTEEQIVLQSAENLRDYPSVREALREERVRIHPWLFDMDDGDILGYNDATKAFESITKLQEELQNRKSNSDMIKQGILK